MHIRIGLCRFIVPFLHKLPVHRNWAHFKFWQLKHYVPVKYLYPSSILRSATTNSMEQSSPWEANRSSASQEIPRILWNLNVHYNTHKILPPVSILGHINPVHAPSFHFLKIHLYITLPSMSRSSWRSLSIRSPHQNPLCTSPVSHTCHTHCPSHSSWFEYQNNIWRGVQIIQLLIK